MGECFVMCKKTFWVLGGDQRQAHLARLLARDGHSVYTYAMAQSSHTDPRDMPRADCVVFPLPVCSAPGILSAPLSERTYTLSTILDTLDRDTLVCGGRADPDTLDRFARHGLTLHDYFQREELTVANAIATAEGAVQLAMEQLPVTVHNLEVLVLGYGRVGTLTAQRFGALGARVTVAARSCVQRTWADAAGHFALPLSDIETVLGGAALVINTIPAPILTAALLSRLNPEALILDLASLPGGVDKAATEQLGLRFIHALALPGKVAPESAGGYIRDTVYSLLRQEGK